MTPKRILVCGGRDFDRADVVAAALYAVQQKVGIAAIIQGGADGADCLAARWGEANGIRVATFQADWASFGKAAGPARNQRMIDDGRPDAVVAFPGGRGTADMVARAERAGLPVWRVQRQ